MDDANDTRAEDAAEKAYAEASAAVGAAGPAPAAAEAPLAFPGKVKRGAVSAANGSARTPARAPAAPVRASAAKEPGRGGHATDRAAPVAKKAKPPVTKPAAAKLRATSAPAKPVGAAARAPAKTLSGQIKDKTMTPNDKTDTADRLKDVIADVQSKAKEAFEKSTAAFGEAGEFAKGNVEALVESGKILAAGLQDLSASTIADARSAFETLTNDAKELAAARTPVEFFKLQAEIARKQFDSAVAQGSKNSEAWLKLASDAFAPISGRVSHAVEKIKQAA